MWMTALRVVSFLLGMAIVGRTLMSAIRTFVLPRGAPDRLAGFVFNGLRRLFDLALRRSRSYETSDRIMAFYAPVSLLLLLPWWLVLVAIGFNFMFWGSGVKTWQEAFNISGSSLLTLGFAKGDSALQTNLEFVEATIGLILVALLIAYLPTMYNAFSRRELAVNMLEVRAGSPPSAIEMIRRFHRLNRLDQLTELWRDWEMWFAEIEESHTSLAALVFFRSPDPNHSWITAAGAVMDAAALIRSTVDVPTDAQADLCIRAGYLALRSIADFFRLPYRAAPSFPADPVSISREEFEAACDQLAAGGVPLKADRDQAWLDFGGWRVNYDEPLLSLCRLTMAPYAPWSSDRSLIMPTDRQRKLDDDEQLATSR